ncbi:MAG TPA: ABC transporter permease [Vicinamibacteria bacterium]|nr:ABC transporter permease [Vicinamibacteria bacterium]
MRDFLLDMRYGLRMLTKTPVVAAVAAASLALGISANTTTFAVANGFLFAPFPFPDQDELVLISEIHAKSTDDEWVSPGNFLDYRARATVFDRLVAYDVLPANLTGGDEPERVRLVKMSPETFRVLDRSPLLGRDFDEKEGVAGAGNVAVLSYPFWQRYFAASRSILGEVVTIDGKGFEVVGVMPQDFDFLPANVDLFVPTSWEDRSSDRERALLVLGRLKEGRTPEEAEAEITAISSQLAGELPEQNEGYRAITMPLRDYFPGRTDTLLMYILLTVSGFVLLIACANIANLLLARAEARQREVAVRSALGAGRSRILRQLLTESSILALLGGALGAFLSVYSVRWVRQSMPAELPLSFLPEMDRTVLLYTLATSMIAGMIFGIAPALHTFADDLREALGESSRGGTATRKRNRLRNAFVVAEIGAALALLIGSGALMNIFREYIMPDPGFEVNRLLTAQLTLSEDRHPDDADVRRFYHEVSVRLSEIPGVTGVAVMNELPRSRASGATEFTIEGRAPLRHNEEPVSGFQAVNATYFTTLGVSIRAGRGVTLADREDSEPVAVVNESFVEKFFPDEDPLGKRLVVKGTPRRIVGVSETIYQARMPDEGGKLGPVIYLPMEQQPVRTKSFALRVQGDPSALAPDLRSAIWAVDPEQPVSKVQTLAEHIETELSGPRIIAVVLTIFASTALLLSAIGIYGVMAHGVAQKTREIGIRMALGAAGRDVVGLVTRQGMRLALFGLLLGTPFAFALTRLVGSTFVSTTGVTLQMVLTVVTVLAAVAFAATYLPARKASRIQPVRALTTE